MPWWNPFSTEAANGKTGAELDAELAALDAQRAARQRDRADALESEGMNIEAEAQREADAEWARVHAYNLQTQDASLVETPGDAFAAEWWRGTERLANAGNSAIGATLKTIFKSIPWSVWIGLVLFGLWKLGLLDKVWKKATE